MKEKTIDYVLRNTWLAVQKMYNEEASKFGATMTTAFTLLSIDPTKGTPSTALGPKMGMEATSLSRILKTLEERELIVRRPNPEDGRGVLINLTAKGLEKRESSRQRVFTFNDKVKHEIGSDKLNEFYDVSEKILDMIQTKKIF
ncbi:transcriptional regulator, MarR family [Formosa sp. Hel3_A1_48]|uniref:MarR family winged helix-turn-helix transcriptional regulator n=1 Tax=Formosa sp. Hel3_A1_48 TaxID=1336795 RepID=UPI00084E35D6|nr:MarR family transcriptional regulator [Formosa sp. Hel3_A1_48]AOR26849.1 transcriptional regulator, MarR family [Formosa sp. Hel3_A1_48]